MLLAADAAQDPDAYDPRSEDPNAGAETSAWDEAVERKFKRIQKVRDGPRSFHSAFGTDHNAEHFPFIEFLEGGRKAFAGVRGPGGSTTDLKAISEENGITAIWVKDVVS